MRIQDELIVESKFCPRENCRAPMETRVHRGEARKQCSKQKCKCITSKYVSTYFSTKGDKCTAVVCLCIHPMHQPPHIPSLTIQSIMCLCIAHDLSYAEAVTSGRPTGPGHTSCTASPGGQPLLHSHVPIIACITHTVCASYMHRLPHPITTSHLCMHESGCR